MPELDFYARAAKLGHSADALKKGKTVETVITVHNIDELKNLLDNGATPAQRSVREKAMFGNTPLGNPQEDDSHSGLLRRVQAHLYGNAELHEADQARLDQAFPLKVMAVSAQDIAYYAGGQNNGGHNLGTSQVYITLNYGTVTLNDKAYITVYNSALNYTMDTLIRNGAPPPGKGDFNILGLTGTTGGNGGTGSTGGDGGGGRNGYCSSKGIVGGSGENGSNGNPGGTGGAGNPGYDGLPSMPATITVNKEIKNTNSIIVLTTSGAGGQGGQGGTGGRGGNGGNGGNGVTCDCTGSGAGNGGSGGRGGDGGNGGRGGNGVDAQGNIIVTVPAAYTSYIHPSSYTAPAGAGGAAGSGGAGGNAGSGGSGGKHNGNGSSGSSGGNGSVGRSGNSGSKSGKPADILIQPL